MPHAIDCFGLTDRGRVRESNEDQFLIADLDKTMLVRQSSLADADHARMFGGGRGHLLVVADGIGGATGGQRASGLAVQTVTRFVLDIMPWFFRLRSREDDAVEELKEALEASRSAVAAAASAERGREKMGTTMTLAYVLWPRLFVVHAGDSRAYLYRGGRLHLITHDHTLAQKMVDEGHLHHKHSRNRRGATSSTSASERTSRNSTRTSSGPRWRTGIPFSCAPMV
jgi:protein phosphatase